MARKPRLELEGGLYHVITRGNDRMDVFHSAEDHAKLLSLLTRQKERSNFFLYAYCLMTNHFHLLVERQAETVGRIMHRVLTGYSQYYNRRHRHVGHVFQGRHKAGKDRCQACEIAILAQKAMPVSRLSQQRS
ncbi:MAG: transposase [Acidobacteria bacterium]|nr:transposase [Acidobacteriota bacterium]